MDPDVPLDPETVGERARVMMQRQGLLVSATVKSDTLLDDHDPSWMLGSHPSSFPYNTGGCPKGMSDEYWGQCILQRYPACQFAQNLGFIADLFNIIQRRSVGKNAWIQFRFRPDQAAGISALTEPDAQTVLDAIYTQTFGENLRQIFDKLPPAAWTLYNGVKAVGGRVVGTPQSFLSLRSKVCATSNFYGAYTCQLNLSPSEMGSEWTFRLAGEKYVFDIDGRPTDRPHVSQCKSIIANNPVACAEFLMAYLRGFTECFLGWPMESDRQTEPNCLFGALHAAYLKYESSQRGGLHAHGQLIQKFLQTEHLRNFMRNGSVMEDNLFAFFESTMCAFFPTPDRPLPRANAGRREWIETMPLVKQGKSML